jgi:hypothetical protein
MKISYYIALKFCPEAFSFGTMCTADKSFLLPVWDRDWGGEYTMGDHYWFIIKPYRPIPVHHQASQQLLLAANTQSKQIKFVFTHFTNKFNMCLTAATSIAGNIWITAIL